jgi:hypothetical protein
MKLTAAESRSLTEVLGSHMLPVGADGRLAAHSSGGGK